MDQSHESLNVIEDDLDYVLVGNGGSCENNGGSLLLHLLDDDSSWDNCNLSRTLSCATSVATNLTLRDLNLVEGDDGMDCDDDDDEGFDGAGESGGRVEFDLDDEEECGGPGGEGKVARRARSDSMQSCSSAATQRASNHGNRDSTSENGGANFPPGRPRLCNKKRRRQMKQLRKAEQAARRAASVSEEVASASAPAAQRRSPPRRAAARAGSRPRSRNPQVAVAQETLASFRREGMAC